MRSPNHAVVPERKVFRHAGMDVIEPFTVSLPRHLWGLKEVLTDFGIGASQSSDRDLDAPTTLPRYLRYRLQACKKTESRKLPDRLLDHLCDLWVK